MLFRPLIEIVDKSEVPAGDEWLGPRERVVQERLRIPKRRDDWRLGRFTAKRLLAPLAGISRSVADLARIEILADADGVPRAHLDGGPWRFALSISHAGGRALAACAPDGVTIGCDIESVEPRSEAFLATFFRERERALCDSVRHGGKALAANAVWSAKESALKALGCGLRADTQSVEALPLGLGENDHTWRPIALHLESGQELCGWWRTDRDAVLTLAASAPCARPVRQSESSRTICER